MKVGIDLGGSHIGIGVVENGTIIEKYETDLKQGIAELNKIENLRNDNNLDEAKSIEKFIEKYIKEKLSTILKKYNIEMVGVASPGTPKEGIITSMVNLGIKELNITKIINEVFNGKVQVKNDAKCAGLAEKKYGSLKPYSDAVFLCIGTGIGGSAFMNGAELKPKRNPGFEVGHMIIKKDGNLCNCGKKGCFETYCSMKKLKNNLIEAMNLNKSVTSEELVSILKEHKQEENVQKIIEEYIENLNIGLSNLIDILEPEAICLGGGFVYFEDVLYERLVENYYGKRYVFNKQTIPEIKLAKLVNDAGIIGATL